MATKSKIQSCPTCFSESIEDEESGLVCCNCGLILEANQEFRDDNFEKSSFIFHSLPLSSKRVSLVKKICLQATQNLCEKLKLNKNMVEQLMKLYQEALYNIEFKQCPYQKKLQLGGVCIYIIMLKNNWIIPIDRICVELNCTLSEFNHIYNRFIQVFPNYKPSHRQLNEHVPFLLNELKIEETEEKNTIEKRVFQLLDILKNVSSFDGMRPINIIQAVIFISWQSIKPMERNNVTLKHFCQKHSFNNYLTTKSRYQEIVNQLAILLKDIPWIKESVKITKKRLAFHIIDILNYSNSLVYHYQEKKLIKNTVFDDFDIKSVIAQHSKSQKEVQEDPEISDSEIFSYLRTEDEVKVIKKLKEIRDIKKHKSDI